MGDMVDEEYGGFWWMILAKAWEVSQKLNMNSRHCRIVLPPFQSDMIFQKYLQNWYWVGGLCLVVFQGSEARFQEVSDLWSMHCSDSPEGQAEGVIVKEGNSNITYVKEAILMTDDILGGQIADFDPREYYLGFVHVGECLEDIE